MPPERCNLVFLQIRECHRVNQRQLHFSRASRRICCTDHVNEPSAKDNARVSVQNKESTNTASSCGKTGESPSTTSQPHNLRTRHSCPNLRDLGIPSPSLSCRVHTRFLSRRRVCPIATAHLFTAGLRRRFRGHSVGWYLDPYGGLSYPDPQKHKDAIADPTVQSQPTSVCMLRVAAPKRV